MRLEEEGLWADRIERKVARFRKQRLFEWAEMIARTEIIWAYRVGQQEAWRQAVARGDLDASRWVQEWSATADVRACEDCIDLDGDRAPLDQPFPKAQVLGIDDHGPPAHPCCRCCLILVPVDEPVRQYSETGYINNDRPLHPGGSFPRSRLATPAAATCVGKATPR